MFHTLTRWYWRLRFRLRRPATMGEYVRWREVTIDDLSVRGVNWLGRSGPNLMKERPLDDWSTGAK